jgi:hypothetical protein
MKQGKSTVKSGDKKSVPSSNNSDELEGKTFSMATDETDRNDIQACKQKSGIRQTASLFRFLMKHYLND